MDIEHSPLSHTELAGLRSQMQLCPGLYDSTTQRLVATIDVHKVNTAEARGIVFDLDEELGNAKSRIYSVTEELRKTKTELYDIKRERDKMRSERDKLRYDAPPRQT